MLEGIYQINYIWLARASLDCGDREPDEWYERKDIKRTAPCQAVALLSTATPPQHRGRSSGLE